MKGDRRTRLRKGRVFGVCRGSTAICTYAKKRPSKAGDCQCNWLHFRLRIPTMSIRYCRNSVAGVDGWRPGLSAEEIAAANRELAERDPAGDPPLGGAAVPPPAADGDRVRGRGLLPHPHARRDRAARSRSSTSKPATSSPRRWSSANGSRQRYGIEVEYIHPEQTVAEYEAEHGGPLYELRPGPVLPRPQDRCRCARRSNGSRRGPGSAPSARTRRPTAARPTWSSGTRSSTW